MRRCLMRFLPIFVLALTLQLLAPIGACLAAAMGVSDPLARAVLCHGTGDSHDADRQSGHDLREGSCALCAAVTPFTPPPPQPSLALVERNIHRVAWHAFEPEVRAAKATSSAQARAPPISS